MQGHIRSDEITCPSRRYDSYEGSVAAARQNDLDWITKTIDVIVCFVLCFVFIVFGGGYQTNWSKSYESCYMTLI